MKTRLPLGLASWLLAITVISMTAAHASPISPLSGDIELNGTYNETFIYNNISDEPATVTLTGSSVLNNVDRQERLFTSSGKLTFAGPGQSLAVNHNGSQQNMGGAIHAEEASFKGLGDISFIGNTSHASGDNDGTMAGGAVNGSFSVLISETTGNIVFEGNTLTGQHTYGGALSAGHSPEQPVPSSFAADTGDYPVPFVVFKSNQGNISFINNVINTPEGDYHPYEALAVGGAIFSNGAIEISGTAGKTLFQGNTINALCYGYGGAIAGVFGIITNNNGLEFSNNAINLGLADTDGEVRASGGAIDIISDLTIDHNRNGISFTGNKISVAENAEATYGTLHGGAINTGNGSLTMSYNRGDILFAGNAILLPESIMENGGGIQAMGGAIHAGSDVKLAGNYNNITFRNNVVQGHRAAGGAIANEDKGGGVPSSLASNEPPTTLGNITLSGNMGDIVFDSNRSEGARASYGGAIYSENNVEILSNEGKILFINNHARNMGYMPAPSALSINSGMTGGGAIYSENLLTISGNKGLVLFDGNTTSSQNDSFVAGGAIFSEGGVIITGNEGDVVFYGNKANGSSQSRMTLGGAIAAAGDVTLRADKSDIIFMGNRMNDKSNAIVMLGSPSGNVPNSISRTSYTSPRLDISATDGHRVVFYDGIDFLPGAFSVKLNEGGEAGTILFSGTGAVVNTGTDRFESYYCPKVDTTLGGGRLVITDGALYGAGMSPGIVRVTGNASIRLEGRLSELRTEDLAYSGKGSLDMAGGTVTADNTITMHHAQVLNSKGGRLSAPTITLHGGIIHDVKSPAHFIVNAEDSFAVSGNLNMRDHGLDVYRTVRFAQPFEIHVLTTEGVIKDGILDYVLSETTNSSRVGDETSNQGHWEMEWRNGDKDLYALWIVEKAMDNPMDVVIPEEQGHLIPNSVWSTASNMNSMKESGYGQVGVTRFTMQHDTNYWVNGLGDFAIHNSVGKIDGYEYSGGGYAVGTDRKWTKNFVGGLAFGQVFGTSKSRNYNASIDQKTIAGMFYGAWLKELNKDNNLLIQGSAAYGVTDNSLHTIYSDGKASRGSWNNDAWLLALRGSWNHALKNNWTVSPFVGLEYEDITQKSFTEGGDKARNFGKANLRNLSLPIGVGVTKQRDFSNGMKWFNTLEISYLPDVYRENPKSDVSCVDTSDAWTARGISNARNAVRAELYSRLFINKTWSTYAGYTLEGRDHSVFHRVSLGVSATF